MAAGRTSGSRAVTVLYFRSHVAGTTCPFLSPKDRAAFAPMRLPRRSLKELLAKTTKTKLAFNKRLKIWQRDGLREAAPAKQQEYRGATEKGLGNSEASMVRGGVVWRLAKLRRRGRRIFQERSIFSLGKSSVLWRVGYRDSPRGGFKSVRTI